MSIKTLKNIDFLVNNDIGHLLETSMEYFGTKKIQKSNRKYIYYTFI